MDILLNWKGCQKPEKRSFLGKHCQLTPLSLKQHCTALFEAFALDKENQDWQYLPYGPFPSLSAFETWVKQNCLGNDPLFYVILNNQQQAVGKLSFLNIIEKHGIIEIGHVRYSPLLQNSIAATEAMFLLMQYVFDELARTSLAYMVG